MQNQDDIGSFEDDPDYKSKTQIKNDMKDITKLGMDLAELSLANLKKLNLNETLLEAYSSLDRIKGNEARKRHFKFIGKRLREIDLEPIELALARFQRGLPLVEPLPKAEDPAEIWADKLLIENHDPENFIAQYSSCDRQQLRQWLRNAGKNAKMRRKLVDYLRSVID